MGWGYPSPIFRARPHLNPRHWLARDRQVAWSCAGSVRASTIASHSAPRPRLPAEQPPSFALPSCVPFVTRSPPRGAGAVVLLNTTVPELRAGTVLNKESSL